MLGIPIPKRNVIAWASAPFDFDGQLVHVRYHGHRVVETDVRVYDASPDSLGLTRVAPEAGIPAVVNEWPLLDKRRERCISTTVPVDVIAGRTVDRDVGLRCRPWMFHRGDVRTIVVMMAAPDDYPDMVLGEHIILHMIVAPRWSHDFQYTQFASALRFKSNTNMSVKDWHTDTAYLDGCAKTAESARASLLPVIREYGKQVQSAVNDVRARGMTSPF